MLHTIQCGHCYLKPLLALLLETKATVDRYGDLKPKWFLTVKLHLGETIILQFDLVLNEMICSGKKQFSNDLVLAIKM